MPIRCISVLLWLVAAVWTLSAFAQAPEQINQQLNGMNAILDTIEASLDRDGLTAEELVEHRREAYKVAADVQSVIAALQPALTDLHARRKALEPAAPAEGDTPAQQAPQSEELARDQAKIDAEYGAVDELAKRATAVQTRANQLAARAASVERDRFTQRIFERGGTIAGLDLWTEVAADTSQGLRGIDRLFGDIGHRFASRGVIGLVPPILFLGALSLVLVRGFRHGLVDMVASRFGHEEPTDFGRAVVACLVAVFVTLVPVAGLLVSRWTANLFDLASPGLLEIVDQTVIAILVVSASIGLSRAFLAPKRPKWRLVDVGDVEARNLASLIGTASATIAIGVFLSGIAHVAHVSQSIIIFIGSFIVLFFAWALILALRPYRKMLDIDASAPIGRFKYQGILRFFSLAGILTAAVIIAGTLLGYVALAWFLCKQVIWICMVFATYALITNLIDAIGSVILDTEHASGGVLARLTGMRQSSVAQFGIVIFGVFKLLLAGLALIFVAAPWGFRSEGAFEQIRTLITGFQIGGLNISLTAIAGALLLFLIGMVFTRNFQSWLSDRFLPTTSIDPGLKNSITTTAGYLGFIVAVVVAFAFIGIDLSQLGLVAGALSVGIGFGLQSIVNNFVSGLILLAERPIKAGDWIIVGNEEGTVKKINVRATEVETFDRATVVIPNSDLISGTVRNWVLGGSMGRVSVVVGVGYGSDADQVRDILIAAAGDHDLVLSYPAPAAFFLDFGDNALIFRLDAYLADIGKGFGVRSDLRFELLRRFREAGIEIPFPQRDVHIRSSDELNIKFSGEKASSD